MQKTIARTFIALAAISASGAALAQGLNPYAGGLNGAPTVGYTSESHYGVRSNDREIKFRVGTDVYRETYTEYDLNGDKLMKEEGLLYGINLGVDFPVGQKGTISLDGVYARGDSDYTGSYMGGNYGDVNVNGIDREMYKVSATYKHQFDILAGTKLGAGVDYRVLTDKLDQVNGGYRRTNQSLWAHLTAERDFHVTRKWTITPQVKASYLIAGRQHSDIFGGMDFHQDKGYGLEAGVGVSRAFDGYDITVKPYYRYTDVRASNEVVGFYEPRNKTNEVGLRLTVTF